MEQNLRERIINRIKKSNARILDSKERIRVTNLRVDYCGSRVIHKKKVSEMDKEATP